MLNRRFITSVAVAGLATVLVACAGTATQSSTGELIDDSVITTRIKAALLKDPAVSAFDVSVETFKGSVQLSGFVGTSAQRARAGEIAQQTPGVTQVFNSIRLR